MSKGIQVSQGWAALLGRLLGMSCPPIKRHTWRFGKMRNKPCWCGSGVKFKKCCLREME